jgi:hypothetical protein
MTTEGGSRVFADDGRALTLDRELKSGGAGSIHRIAGSPDLVAKIYHSQVDHTIYERKVEAMIKLVPDLPDISEGGVREVQIAWPRFLLRNERRRFVGYAMPVIDFATSVEIECVLQERQARAQQLPTGLGAKVTIAANLASVIAELHHMGHYVVDLKPVNLRFYRQSMHIAMLDCDGFSIKGDGERFSAPQYTPEYLAPEFHQPELSGGSDLTSNEESQDRFALAVIVFQLLNFGIHPFTGRPTSDRTPTDIPGRIAHRCYAYGLRANREMAPNLASGHAAMPLELRNLFDRAFSATGMSRPSADDWVSRLRAYGRRSTGLLVACRANARHQHFAGLPCAACTREGLLTRASSVVRTPVRTAPRWTALRPIPRVFGRRLPRPPPPPPAPPSVSVPRTLTPNPWVQAAPFLPLLFPLFFFLLGPSLCSRSKPWNPREVESTQEEREPDERLTPSFNLDQVLAAGKGSSKEEIVRQLSRLPGSRGEYRPEECLAAATAWREKVRWTKDDPAFTNDSSLPPDKPRDDACEDLYFLASIIVRIEELCKRRLDAPGVYPGIGEDRCEENRVIETGIAALRIALVYGRSRDQLLWQRIAEVFLLSDDVENAQSAFVVSALLYRRIGFDDFVAYSSMIEGPWLHERADILQARAWAKIGLWYNESLSDETAARANAHWPELPPAPRKAKHRPARK